MCIATDTLREAMRLLSPLTALPVKQDGGAVGASKAEASTSRQACSLASQHRFPFGSLTAGR
jgi:hypothetical protein